MYHLISSPLNLFPHFPFDFFSVSSTFLAPSFSSFVPSNFISSQLLWITSCHSFYFLIKYKIMTQSNCAMFSSSLVAEWAIEQIPNEVQQWLELIALIVTNIKHNTVSVWETTIDKTLFSSSQQERIQTSLSVCLSLLPSPSILSLRQFMYTEDELFSFFNKIHSLSITGSIFSTAVALYTVNCILFQQ